MLSLIVCTWNRAQALARTLESISKLETKFDWELIVVYSESGDNTAAIVEQFASLVSFPVVLVRDEIPGLASARNAGIRMSRGDILVFTDDDCYPFPDYLERSAECFENAAIGFAGGRILLYDPTDAPVTIQLSERKEHLPPRSFIVPGLISGACMAVRRAAGESIGWFYQELGRSSFGEDWDIMARVSAAGWSGLYEPAMGVYHHHGRKAESAKALERHYDYCRGVCFMKLILNPATRMIYLKGLYWDLRSYWLAKNYSAIGRESKGMLRYLLFFIATRR